MVKILMDFDIDVTDYQEQSMDLETTVGQLYEDTKFPIMRFYLTTKRKQVTEARMQSNIVEALETQEHTQGHTLLSSSPRVTPDLPSESVDTTEVIFVGSNRELYNFNMPLSSATADFFKLRPVPEPTVLTS